MRTTLTIDDDVLALAKAMAQRQQKSVGEVISALAPLLAALLALSGHVFWSEDIGILDAGRADATRLLTSAQVTDTCLLALARAHGGQLASFDRQLVTDAVPEGGAHLHLIG